MPASGKELHFENAGVIGGNEVFRDRESGSRWQQSSLEAISGPMKGQHLQLAVQWSMTEPLAIFPLNVLQ
jgi:hypothetical protein